MSELKREAGRVAVRPLLDVSGLACRRGGMDLFSQLNFALAPGEFLLVKGENGCGKTTLLRALCGLTRPVAGVVRWRGESVWGHDAFAAELHYVGHREAVKDELTPLENLVVSGGLRGERYSEAACEGVLAEVGLAEAGVVPVRYLSQGQRRRCALARMLLSPAKLWILDEPYNALDQAAVEWLSNRVRDHLAGGGIVVATSHQPVTGVPEPRVLNLG